MRIAIAGLGKIGNAHHTFLSESHEMFDFDVGGSIRDYEEVDNIIICVSTPTAADGSCDMSNVIDVVGDCPSGTSILIRSTISLEGYSYLRETFPYHWITYAPEFVRGATAYSDLVKTKVMQLAGDETEFWGNVFLDVNPSLKIEDDYVVGELILAKYFRNAFLATKVSFFDQLSDLCERANVHYDVVRKVVCDDKRIGHSHTELDGTGWGGHCFPKDVSAICQTGREHNTTLGIIEEVQSYNSLKKSKNPL